MNFNAHSEIAGRHAFLSPSSHHWLNYTDQKLEARYTSARASQRGTALHKLAEDAINLRVRLPNTPVTINLFVNDAIDLRLDTEVGLYYSENCFGHADAIGFDGQVLYIHDLKTGLTKTSFTQLEVYAAIFCLEYGVSPYDINIELRIYQNDEVHIHEPFAETIHDIMEKIVATDVKIEAIKREEGNK